MAQASSFHRWLRENVRIIPYGLYLIIGVYLFFLRIAHVYVGGAAWTGDQIIWHRFGEAVWSGTPPYVAPALDNKPREWRF